MAASISYAQQALAPLLDPAEMANGASRGLAARLRQLPYADEFRPNRSVQPMTRAGSTQQAAAALARFELEDPSFHPYSSRFDRYLQGQAVLSSRGTRGPEAVQRSGEG